MANFEAIENIYCFHHYLQEKCLNTEKNSGIGAAMPGYIYSQKLRSSDLEKKSSSSYIILPYRYQTVFKRGTHKWWYRFFILYFETSIVPFIQESPCSTSGVVF